MLFLQEDNFFNEEERDIVFNDLIGYDSKINWRFRLTTQPPLKQSLIPSEIFYNRWREKIQNNYGDNPQAVANVKDNPDSSTFALLQKRFTEFCIANSLENPKILRVKSNILTKTINNPINIPHIDQSNSHFVFLYYVCDSDGDTILYKERYPSKPTEFEIDKRVSPKMNRAIIFDGLQYHSSSNPVEHNYRCVINMDFTAENKIRYN